MSDMIFLILIVISGLGWSHDLDKVREMKTWLESDKCGVYTVDLLF